MMNTQLLVRFVSAIGLPLMVVAMAACSVRPLAPAAGTPAAGALRSVAVENVQVQVGVGSPIPVDVFVSGTWPDLCAQVAEIKQTVNGTRVDISLLATPADPNCPPDRLGLPFRIAIPLNGVELPAGAYTVTVNGVSAPFDWTKTGPPPELSPVQVDHVEVQVGVGSPIPVHVIVDGNFPSTCSQLKEITQHRFESLIQFVLMADKPLGVDCREDSLPFRITLPVNMVGVAAGAYTVDANGVSVPFNWDPAQAGTAQPDTQAQPGDAYTATVALATCNAAQAVQSQRVPSDRPGIDFIVSHDPAWGCAGYTAATSSTVLLTSSFALERGADKGLIHRVLDGNRQVISYTVPTGAIEAVVRVQYDIGVTDLTDVVFTPDKLIVVRTLTANAGMFLISDVYELPRQDDDASYFSQITSTEQAAMLRAALDYYNTAVKPATQ